MIKIQKNDFNIEEEIFSIKNNLSNVGSVTTFIGYVRQINDYKKVKSIELEVYEKMANQSLQKILNIAKKKWSLLDSLIIHRYGKLYINEKIVLVATFAEHRNESFLSCNFIMDYLKKEAPFWKKEYYDEDYKWLENN